MTSTIAAWLLYYAEDGEDVAPVVTIVGHLVDDEKHGRVLEFVLPRLKDSSAEHAILIPVSELRRLSGHAGA